MKFYGVFGRSRGVALDKLRVLWYTAFTCIKNLTLSYKNQRIHKVLNYTKIHYFSTVFPQSYNQHLWF